MTDLTRRDFLQFIGASGALAVFMPIGLLRQAHAVDRTIKLPFTPVRVPHPLPIFATHESFLAAGLNGVGTIQPIGAELPAYTVIDDVVVPPEWERYTVVSWGERIFPDARDYFGYNCDYIGYVPIAGRKEGWLVVNHEYVSYPIHQFAPEAPAGFPEGPEGRSFEEAVHDLTLPDAAVLADLSAERRRLLLGEFLYNVGLSVLRVRRDRDGRYRVVPGARRNRRVHGLSGLGINAGRSDAYAAVTGWGGPRGEFGDDRYLLGTGPAARDVFEGVNSDGLGNRIIGTIANCSGGTTPWGTVLSAEENFQGSGAFFVGVTETVKPDGTQTGYLDGTVGAEFGLAGEKYGWMVEIDPARPATPVKKHTALGRFRHENIAFRAEAHHPLVCYLGDDRRGGHWWKFVSAGRIRGLKDPANSALFEEGQLYVARFHADGSGDWIPLSLDTPTDPNVPSLLGSRQFAEQGLIDRDGRTALPARIGVPGVTSDGGFFFLSTVNESEALPFYQGKTVGDFYTSLGAALCDAFAVANLVGGTPCARPEDCEVHPVTKEVYLANTDAAAGGDGYPDSRIFTVAKYKSDAGAAQQSGDIIRLTEDSPDGSGTRFRWLRFSKAGEAGTLADSAAAQPKAGMGYANVDNLVFDSAGNLWGVTDMSTDLHNGYSTGPDPQPRNIEHAGVGSGTSDGGGALVGVFGNNWLFQVPVSGPHAGLVIPVAIGPNRCEMTGPTLVHDTLLLSVQHPGEDCAIRADAATPLSRAVQMLKIDGSGLFEQIRTLAKGSQWPSNAQGATDGVPKPAVIGIRPRRG